MTDSPNQGGQGYSGQEGLTDGLSEFNATCFLVRQLMGELRTLVPVEIVAVDSPGGVAAAGTVDVRPLVSQVDGVGTVTSHGLVLGLPYLRLQGGANAVIIDPEVGDIGYVVCADRDISAVKSSKAMAPPGSKRRFSLSDGVYIGGILNSAPTQYVMFSADGVTIADKSGNTITMASAGITLNGILFGRGAAGTYRSHVHAVTAAPGTTGVPTG